MKLNATRAELIEVAKGERPADIYIKNGTVINVYSGELLKHNVAIYKDSIAYLGESEHSIGEQTNVIDATGKYISPGFIESHAHPWVFYNPVSVTGKVLPLGTTTTVNDNLFFYLHMGAKGLKDMIKDLRTLPGSFFWLIRLVSQSDYPKERQWFNQKDIQSLLELDDVLGSAEVTRWPLLYDADPFVLDTVEHVKKLGKVVDSHNAGCNYEKLNAIAASGVNACHEAITTEEALNRLRLGIWTVLRNSSLRPDLPEIIKLITEQKVNTSRVIMTTDGPHPSFIDEEGFVDGLVRKAVELGIDPIQAIQMVTINPATYLRLDEYIGGLAPGRQADVLLLPDLTSFRPEQVIAKGEIVAENGELTTKLPNINWEQYLVREPFTVAKSVIENPDLYRYPHPVPEQPVPVAHFLSTVISKRTDATLPSKNGFIDLSQHEDLVQAFLIDRNGNWVSKALLQNYAKNIDGLATTYNTTTELLVMGKDPKAMAKAAARVHELNGGVVLVDNDEIVLEIPLPLTGMMTTSTSFDTAVTYQNQFLTAMQERGYPFHDILYSLLFLTCDFLPGLRLTPHGLYEVKKDKILDPAVPVAVTERI
ncbi:adenine deaminase C-terminal domain-containing protein [Desertibacillus haloalkaliphilus]|uniref:adenine deaminase C-terminal domain-containing protein n=1 Tax=Desertibacillus haloalkaliphilus TaxID=1328930 RepID=UPI001C259F45|nr:adenine deaminase C-terminal domain-containing protein [Desertibacillus haloalkaliphilus]MBU8905791.1 amidohydrolase family protein [Desertibacillus haloalkaliphilus]